MTVLTHMRNPRHGAAISAFERVTPKVPGNQKYIVIVYDGPDVPEWDRKASYFSDAPAGDVKLICNAIAEQIRDA